MRIRTVLTAIAALGLVPAFIAGTAHTAKADTCSVGFETAIYYGNDHAWNDWNGDGAGGFVKLYQSITTENSLWCAIFVGNVGADGPFDSGSGMNTRYDGRPIYVFAALNNQSLCIDQSNFQTGTGEQIDDGENQLEPCATGFDDGRQQFVYSSSDYFASIFATDESYQNYGTGHYNPNNIPELVGDAYPTAGSDANGEDAFNDYNYQLQWTCTGGC
jgi:hypothetical protein